MSWTTDLMQWAAPYAADLFLPSYPEGGSGAELDEYYNEMLGVVSDAEWVLSKLGYDNEYVDKMINEFVRTDFMDAPPFPGDPSLFTHYLAGGGEPKAAFDTQEELDEWIGHVHGRYGDAPHESEFKRIEGGWGTDGFPRTREVWRDTKNPKYPASEGWEWLQYEPNLIIENEMNSTRFNLEGNDIHNKLGIVSTVRRKYDKDSNKYEYQIVEDWDLLPGSMSWGGYVEDVKQYGSEFGVPTFDYNTQEYTFLPEFDPDNPEHFDAVEAFLLNEDVEGFENLPYVGSSRSIPEDLVRLAHEYAPDFFQSYYGDNRLDFDPTLYGYSFLERFAKPYDITGTGYIEGE